MRTFLPIHILGLKTKLKQFFVFQDRIDEVVSFLFRCASFVLQAESANMEWIQRRNSGTIPKRRRNHNTDFRKQQRLNSTPCGHTKPLFFWLCSTRNRFETLGAHRGRKTWLNPNSGRLCLTLTNLVHIRLIHKNFHKIQPMNLNAWFDYTLSRANGSWLIVEQTVQTSWEIPQYSFGGHVYVLPL